MKIAFFDNSKLSYTPQTPFDQPLGGTQSAAAYLSAALAARGHDVTLINENAQQDRVLGVTLPGRSAARASVVNQFDVLVGLTNPMGRRFRQAGVRVPMVCWQHKAAAAIETRRFSELAERAAWNAFAFVSEQQRQTFIERFGIDGTVLRNAASPSALEQPVDQACFLDRGADPSLIYASAPGRGLDILLFSFALIRQALPGAVLRICSDQGMYGIGTEQDEYAAFYALAHALDGVEFIGTVSQTALAQQFARTDIFAYPTNFLETSCIVAMESAATGCLFAGHDLGPLRETMAGFGVFTPYTDTRSRLSRDFATTVIEAVSASRADPQTYKRRRLKQIQWFRATHTWDVRAQAWESWLTGLLARPRPLRDQD